MIMKSFGVKLPLLILCLFVTFDVNLQAKEFNVLKPGDQLTDLDSLVSPNRIYTLTFFTTYLSDQSQLNSTSIRYLGIEFMSDLLPKYVWIANRDDPLSDSSGILNLTKEGNLILTSDFSTVNITINTVKPDSNNSNITVTLSDYGNLILRAGGQTVWQSLEQGTNTFLPGSQVGIFGLKTKNPTKRILTSWLTSSVASPGAFTLGVDPENRDQLTIWQRGAVYWRSGNWDGYSFRNLPSTYRFNYTSNENEMRTRTFLSSDYIDFPKNASSSIQLTSSTDLIASIVLVGDGSGGTYSTLSLCRGDCTGCVVNKKLLCKSGDEFTSRQIDYDFSDWEDLSDNFSIGLVDCQEMCKKKCSCLAYMTMRNDGSGCQVIQEKKSLLLTRIHEMPKDGTTIYVRSSILEVEGRNSKTMQLGLGIGGSVAFLTACISCYFVWRKCFAKSNKDDVDKVLMHELEIAAAENHQDASKSKSNAKKNHELPLFTFACIKDATKNFDPENFLGQGGFGHVYKGTLEDGVEIAVKRVSQKSTQGVKEFANEVTLISKLQHRNLVRLLGCCIHGEERILIYEYLSNKSLDAFIFDDTQRQVLDLKMRLSIIEGIAQGLLYLHKYSRLKIIHRDLKAGNVLLDANMNPKISDFGTARIFTENEFEANTKRIVGTYGYMSPEYAMNGLFSEKSDVFSYGVMLLEIISSRKNMGFYHLNRFTTLLGYAWELWEEGRGLELVDPGVNETYPPNEALRCIHIALLCVQESADDRPTMSDVMSMLINESMTLPTPKQPSLLKPHGLWLPDITLQLTEL